MVGPSTRGALNRRALGAANWLHSWAKLLEDELEKQNIKCDYAQMLRDNLPNTSISITRKEEELMVTLKADLVANLTFQMYQQEAELRRFAEPIKLRRR
jgi:hypothetical protein